MILPTINFNGVNKVMFANSEISKVYCGSHLVWERKAMSNCVVMYMDAKATKSADALRFRSDFDPRVSASNIDKIVIMEKYTINGSYVKEIVRSRYFHKIGFTDTLGALTGIKEDVEVGSKIEIYLK